ncbi:NLPA lipoprotein, partial [Aquicoccus sp. SCR17]|nr:NLPA lipoprotein [Carideicomes alvinocaridis]
TVAIPNDTVNQARAINVLVAAGLLKLSNETIRPEVRDIDEAASTVKVQPVAAQQTVNALESVQGSVINNTFSADAGIDTNTALFKDDPEADSAKPFVNGFAVRREDRDNETYQKVAALYHEQAVLDESAKLSSDTSVPVQLDAAQIDETLKQYQDAI